MSALYTNSPCTVVMNLEISYRDQNCVLFQAVNIFISAVKLDILIWSSMGIDWPWNQPRVAIQGTAVSGQTCSLLYKEQV